MTSEQASTRPEDLDAGITADAVPGSSEPAPAEADSDTEGHMLPDGTAQYMARARERDIRQHLSQRELKEQGKKQRQHK